MLVPFAALWIEPVAIDESQIEPFMMLLTLTVPPQRNRFAAATGDLGAWVSNGRVAPRRVGSSVNPGGGV